VEKAQSSKIHLLNIWPLNFLGAFVAGKYKISKAGFYIANI